MNENQPTSIWTPPDVRIDIEQLKLNKSESIGNVLRRLIKFWKENHK